jgi:hypothetical protein
MQFNRSIKKARQKVLASAELACKVAFENSSGVN